MPRRKMKKNKAKGQRRRGVKRSNALGIPRSIGGVPDFVDVKLKYVDFFTLLAAPTQMNSLNYGLNCLWDPYLGLLGHQPSNFDLFMQMYTRYTAKKCHVKMSYFTDAVSSGIPQAFGMIPTATGSVISPGTDPVSIMEQPRGVYSDIPSGITTLTLGKPLQMTVDIGKWFGITPAVLHGPGAFSGSATANPSSIVYLEVWVASFLLNSPSANSISFKIELEFETRFSNPKIAEFSLRQGNSHRVIDRRDPAVQLNEQKESAEGFALVPAGGGAIRGSLGFCKTT